METVVPANCLGSGRERAESVPADRLVPKIEYSPPGVKAGSEEDVPALKLAALTTAAAEKAGLWPSETASAVEPAAGVPCTSARSELKGPAVASRHSTRTLPVESVTAWDGLAMPSPLAAISIGIPA